MNDKPIAERSFLEGGNEYTIRAFQLELGDVVITLWAGDQEVIIRYPSDLQAKLQIVLPISARMTVDKRYGVSLTAVEMNAIEEDFRRIVAATIESDRRKAANASGAQTPS